MYVFLLIVYFTLEIVSLITSKTLAIHKIFIYFRLRRELKKIIPSWWGIKEINIVTIEKSPKLKRFSDYGVVRGEDGVVRGYEVYVEALSKIEKGRWTNAWIIVDYLGRIKYEGLSSSIEFLDRGSEMKIKEWNRDKLLNDLGI